MEWINNLCGGRSCSTEEEENTGNRCTIHDIKMEKCHQKEKKICPTVCKKKKTAENYELKKKYSNLATKERRKAIKEFWMKKTDDLKQKPWEFFKTFRPFLGMSKGSNTISLETEENSVETDESIISNKFAHYFTNIASTIGGNHVLDLSEEDHKNHTSINPIRKEQLDIDSQLQMLMRSLRV